MKLGSNWRVASPRSLLANVAAVLAGEENVAAVRQGEGRNGAGGEHYTCQK